MSNGYEDLKFLIVDNQPEEFGGPELVSAHRNEEEAKIFMRLFKGLNGDSRSCEHFELITLVEIKP